MKENKLDIDYQNLCWDIIRNGEDKGDRTGTGTTSVFGRTIRHNMADGFPLLTTKKMSLKNIKTELFWFLQGDTNIKFLVDRGCNIWVGDAYKHYLKQYEVDATQEWLPPQYLDGYYDNECSDLDKESKYYKRGAINRFLEGRRDKPDFYLTLTEFVNEIKTNDDFAKEWGDLGPIYGKQWRDWGGIDQIQELIDTLTNNPDSRRMMVNAWNVPEIKDAVLPPCHYGFQCYTNKLTYKERYEIWYKNNWESGMEYDPNNVVDIDDPYFSRTPKRKLSLMWNQRSVDTGLGLPYNIASYGLLLLMLADEVGMVPGELIGILGDTHLYSNHIEPIKEQLFREPRPLGNVIVRDGIHSHCDGDDIILQNYSPHPSIKLPLSN